MASVLFPTREFLRGRRFPICIFTYWEEEILLGRQAKITFGKIIEKKTKRLFNVRKATRTALVPKVKSAVTPTPLNAPANRVSIDERDICLLYTS